MVCNRSHWEGGGNCKGKIRNHHTCSSLSPPPPPENYEPSIIKGFKGKIMKSFTCSIVTPMEGQGPHNQVYQINEIIYKNKVSKITKSPFNTYCIYSCPVPSVQVQAWRCMSNTVFSSFEPVHLSPHSLILALRLFLEHRFLPLLNL